ncbi:MAG TPA: MFS transporter, partial [Usitatibacter sp.]|nr:MFS transporter [Usitatibacter sp.]
MGELNPGVRRREVFGWAMYDFANSGYTTVVLTAVFNAYFVNVIAQKAAWGTFAWTVALSISYLIVMFLGPVVGAWTDAHATKKKALAGVTVICVIGTAALAGASEGAVAWAVFFVIVSNVAYAIG